MPGARYNVPLTPVWSHPTQRMIVWIELQLEPDHAGGGGGAAAEGGEHCSSSTIDSSLSPPMALIRLVTVTCVPLHFHTK